MFISCGLCDINPNVGSAAECKEGSGVLEAGLDSEAMNISGRQGFDLPLPAHHHSIQGNVGATLEITSLDHALIDVKEKHWTRCCGQVGRRPPPSKSGSVVQSYRVKIIIR